MSPSKLIAARDEHGSRPLCYGQTADGRYIIASESCALDAVGAAFITTLSRARSSSLTGRAYAASATTVKAAAVAVRVRKYIYFARPDSVIDGCQVHTARVRAGSFLALEHPVQADVVIGVPDSGLDAAIGYSRQSGIPL